MLFIYCASGYERKRPLATLHLDWILASENRVLALPPAVDARDAEVQARLGSSICSLTAAMKDAVLSKTEEDDLEECVEAWASLARLLRDCYQRNSTRRHQAAVQLVSQMDLWGGIYSPIVAAAVATNMANGGKQLLEDPFGSILNEYALCWCQLVSALS